MMIIIIIILLFAIIIFVVVVVVVVVENLLYYFPFSQFLLNYFAFSCIALCGCLFQCLFQCLFSIGFSVCFSVCFGDCFSVCCNACFSVSVFRWMFQCFNYIRPADILNCFSNCPADNSGYQSVLEDVPGRHLWSGAGPNRTFLHRRVPKCP